MIKLNYEQFIECIYSSDPIGSYEAILESLRVNRSILSDDSELLDKCIDQSLIDMFNSEDQGFSDEWIEEDYRDSFFDDQEIGDFPL